LYAGERPCSNVAFGSSDRSIIVVGTRFRVGELADPEVPL
jgi:hypothetical protein